MIKIFIAIMFMVGIAFAGDGDITQTEVIADVAGWKLDTLKFQVFTKTCTVTYRKVDASENYLDEFNVFFRDVPEDEENEELTEYTDLITEINKGSNIEDTIMKAVKIKLGI